MYVNLCNIIIIITWPKRAAVELLAGAIVRFPFQLFLCVLSSQADSKLLSVIGRLPVIGAFCGFFAMSKCFQSILYWGEFS